MKARWQKIAAFVLCFVLTSAISVLGSSTEAENNSTENASTSVLGSSTEPENKSTESTEPENKSTESTEPENKLTESTDSENKLTESTEPENKSTESTEPENKLTESTDSENKSTETSDSENKLAESTDSENKLTESTDSENKSTESTEPENKLAESIDSENKLAESIDSENKSTESTEPENKLTESTDPENKLTESIDSENKSTESTEPEDKSTESKNELTEPENTSTSVLGSSTEAEQKSTEPENTSTSVLHSSNEAENKSTESTESENEADVEYGFRKICEMALKHSEEIKLSTEAVNISKQEKKKALSVLIPKLSAFGDYADYNESTERTPDNIAYGVRFDHQFTINGNELNLLHGANDLIAKSEYDLDTTKQEYLYGVILAYFNVARVQLGISISKLNVDRLEKHKSAVVARLNVGEITRTALFGANAELSSAKTALVRSQNELNYTRAVLASLAGLPDNFRLKEIDVSEMAPLKDTLEDLTEEALLKRPELKANEKSKDASLNNLKYKKGEYWPKLSLEGAYTDSKLTFPYTNPISQTESEMTTDDDYVMIGATLSFLFYDGGMRRSEISRARAEKRSVDLQIKNQKKKITLEVKEAYLNIISQRSVLESLEDQLASSREHYNAVSKGFKHGLVNSLDVVDANSLLINTEREIVDARYSYKLAEIQLKRAKGTLISDLTSK